MFWQSDLPICYELCRVRGRYDDGTTMVRRYADDTTINEQSSMTGLLHETAICLCFFFRSTREVVCVRLGQTCCACVQTFWLFVAQRGSESVSHCGVPSPGVCAARIILASFDPTCPLTKFETNEFGYYGHHVCFLHLQRGRALGVARPADEVAYKRSIRVQ